MTRLVDSIEWYFLPVANPDGYAYTWSTDRMWRKFRRPTHDPSCPGVDGNRNWPTAWRGNGNPCSGSFSGYDALDQPETHHIDRFFRDLVVSGAIDMHCCGTFWTVPWGHTSQPSPDFARQNAVSTRVAAAIRRHTGREYRIGSVIDEGYGISFDSWYAEWNAMHAVLIELTGTFTSPTSMIRRMPRICGLVTCHSARGSSMTQARARASGPGLARAESHGMSSIGFFPSRVIHQSGIVYQSGRTG